MLYGSQQNFIVISDVKEPFSGAYLHKLFLLTLFNFQGTFRPASLGGSLLIIPRENLIVKNFLEKSKKYFLIRFRAARSRERPANIPPFFRNVNTFFCF